MTLLEFVDRVKKTNIGYGSMVRVQIVHLGIFEKRGADGIFN